MNSSKDFLTSIGFLALVLLLAPLWFLVQAVLGLHWLWEKWSYAAQCLRYPPPPGGMYGNMARHYREKQQAERRERR